MLLRCVGIAPRWMVLAETRRGSGFAKDDAELVRAVLVLQAKPRYTDFA
ncbi:hypothetical protein Pd630_LPD16099 (plasmid) [Rhodococcus opacus PD630]|nr:hypothetical protein Pd630_LPD16099 [Rhodococcus opacus PD630]